MCNQLKVEFYKLRHFWLLYITAALMACLAFPFGYLKLSVLAGSNGIYHAFRDAICDTSLLFIPAVVTAQFVGSDFSTRTIHNEITTGYSRLSVLLIREIPAFLLAIILHFIYVGFTMFGTGLKTGFSVSMFSIQDLYWYVTVLLQLAALQSILVLITFVCAKAYLAIAAVVIFTFITCNMLRNFFNGKIFTRSCFCLARDNTYDTLFPTIIASLLTLAAAVILTYFIFRKKEIK